MSAFDFEAAVCDGIDFVRSPTYDDAKRTVHLDTRTDISWLSEKSQEMVEILVRRFVDLYALDEEQARSVVIHALCKRVMQACDDKERELKSQG